MGCHSYCQWIPVFYFERELKIEFKFILSLAITGRSQQYLILTSDPSTQLSTHRGLTDQINTTTMDSYVQVQPCWLGSKRQCSLSLSADVRTDKYAPVVRDNQHLSPAPITEERK